MDVQKALKWVDELVLFKTGSHLNSLQQSILTGVWNNQKYKEIADNYHCTEANVKRVAGNLWQLISEELDEKVSKVNFRATMERYYISNSPIRNFVQANLNKGNINVYGESFYSGESAKNIVSAPPQQTTEQRVDLSEAPELQCLYNRSAEIITIKHWIVKEKIRIITLFGLPGIGKTALAREIVEQIKANFDFVVWRNCTNTLTVQVLQTNLIQFFSQGSDIKFSSLIEYLRSSSCLIVLDEVQELFANNELAGTYLSQFKDYDRFWQKIVRSNHNSCFLLLSWETPTELASLEEENRHCRSLKINGLGETAIKILTSKNLKDENKWKELIQIYGSNPSWLNIIASTIQDLFNGSVERFLSYPSLFLGNLESRLHTYYQRLSDSEKIVICWFAHQEAVDFFYKPEDLALSDADFLKVIQSLKKRGLLEKITHQESSLFVVPTLFKAYFQRDMSI
ncbi:MAG: ATP-binding protein [Desertifilum sp. SIO1I2]|nr:ATP-binding protein [Desertifilum sp. SIO1I2]